MLASPNLISGTGNSVQLQLAIQQGDLHLEMEMENSKDEAHKYRLGSSAYVSNFSKSGSDVKNLTFFRAIPLVYLCCG